MTTTDTEAALLAAIRENPGEDAPRLVYADWLEENAGTVQRCSGTHHHDGEKFPLISGGFAWDAHGVIHRSNPKQPHHHCDEKCRVSDGRAELAAFVRAQVLTSQCEVCCGKRTFCYGDYLCSNCQPHYNRERELWPAVRGAFEGDGCEFLLDSESVKIETLTNYNRTFHAAGRPTPPLVIIRRGLPAIVRCALAEWMVGEKCPCGVSITGSLTHRYPWPKCPNCHGTGRTPAIGPKLAQRWPIVAVEVADDPLNLPSEITNRFPPGQYTPDQFRSTLSDALIAWARSQPIGEGRS